MKKKIMKTLLSVAVLSAITSSTWAAGTAAGTDIDNKATLNYSVGGTSQPPIESSEAGNSTPGAGNGSATTFKVDKKIDLLVTAGSGVNVVPGTTGQAITFTLTNEGNSTEDFSFSTTQVTGDNFDTLNCTTPANVTLAADATQTITVNCDIPANDGTNVVNGNTSKVDLKATAVGVTETTGAESANTVDTVFADDTGTATDGADRNAQHSAVNTYTVNTADITVKKTSAVTEDPFNGTTNPKRIPGATIEYTITVSNAAGAATATGIVISDPVQSDLENITATVTGGTSTTASVSGNTVSTAPFDLAAGQTATLTITAKVK